MMTMKNKNILNNGMIQSENIINVSYDDLINIVNKHIDFYNNEDGKKDLGYFYHNIKKLKFAIAPLQDTNNYGEPENKRVQDRFIQYAKEQKADLIGIYPIKNGDKFNFCFVLWPYKIIKSVKTTKNAGVKVKLYDIYFAIFKKYSNDLKKPREMQYKYECFSEREFDEKYLKIDSNQLDIEYTIDLINDSKEDLSIYINYNKL